MKKVEVLRKKYPRFVYENFDWKIGKKDLKISFNFRIESAENRSSHIYFKPKVIIKNIDKNQIERVGVEFRRVLDNLIFNLGLIEILSYWKATCSPEIEIKAGYLNKEQIKWWKDLIKKGMGQFFYENKINFRKPSFLKIKSLPRSDLCQIDRGRTCGKITEVRPVAKLKNKVLVPVGGGKDSVVTLEILSSFAKASAFDKSSADKSKDKEKIQCLALNPTRASKKIMKIARCKSSIIVERKIDKKLLELNQKGFLNGHTPFSAYLAFLSVLITALFEFKYIAFSNERSSNEGNVKYLGIIINHQYSKSFDFEKKFREYSQKYLTSGVQYFSFLRPLYEIQIAKIFSKYPQYFNAFLSCNEAYKTYSGKKKPTRKWCGKCSKCLFVFVSFYPFIEEKAIRIFGKNLFADKNLLPLMLQLIGEEKFKPFECVGTKKESLVAFYLNWKKYTGLTGVKLPFLLKYFQNKVLAKYPDLEKESKKIMNSWNKNHFLPKKFEETLKKTISS